MVVTAVFERKPRHRIRLIASARREPNKKTGSFQKDVSPFCQDASFALGKLDAAVNGDSFARGVGNHQRIDVEFLHNREVGHQLRQTQQRFFHA